MCLYQFMMTSHFFWMMTSMMMQWRGQNAKKKLRTPKGDYWIKQWFSSIAYLFEMGTSHKRKEFAPKRSEFFSLRAVPYGMENHVYHIRWLSWMLLFFITHERNCVMAATTMRWIDTKDDNYLIIAIVWRVKQLVNWQIEYQARVYWYQVYQAQLWERMLKCLESLVIQKAFSKLAW